MPTPVNTILVGDCIEQMKLLDAESVHCVVTSPPYYGLRDYGCDGQIGLEQTPADYIAKMVEVFREVHRILRRDGTLWINLGDSYATGAGTSKNPGSQAKPRNGHEGKHGYVNDYPALQPNRMPIAGLKAGDLCNIPHRVAAALQGDGWYWRSTIIWHKPNPMPHNHEGWQWERCGQKVYENNRGKEQWRTGANLSKPQQDHCGKNFAQPSDFIPCPGCKKCLRNGGLVLTKGRWRPTTGHEYIFMLSKTEQYFCDSLGIAEAAICANSGRRSKRRGEFLGKNSLPGKEAFRTVSETRNPRTVWTLKAERFRGAHFATFPSSLPSRCIQASTSRGGCCSKCGAPHAPVISFSETKSPKTNAYLPTCDCCAQISKPLVVDPFGGSGTTAQVAQHLGCDWIICELNPAYALIAEKRIATPLRDASKRIKSQKFQTELF